MALHGIECTFVQKITQALTNYLHVACYGLETNLSLILSHQSTISIQIVVTTHCCRFLLQRIKQSIAINLATKPMIKRTLKHSPQSFKSYAAPAR